jgi:phenylacetate-CoA ligase
VAHAYDQVPYYRELFDRHGVRTDDVRTADDLQRLPITTRRTLAELPLEALVARGVSAKRLLVESTSGSSGRPLRVHHTWAENRVSGAFIERALRSFGARSDDRIVVVRALRAEQSTAGNRMHRLFEWLRPSRGQPIDCGLPPTAILDAIRALRATVLHGYAGVLARLARSTDAVALRRLGLRFVVTGGEVLTPAMRADISDAFGVPVYDFYASHEFGVIAWECARTAQTGAYHASDDALVLELLHEGRPARPGERGVVVGTNLFSYAVPLIRYELGDLVEPGPGPCPCGQPFTSLRSVSGRMIDQFTLPSGRVVHPYAIFLPIRERCPWLRAFRVTQLRREHFVMQVVVAPGTAARDVALLRELAMPGLEAGVSFEVEVVPDLPSEGSGKFRMYRSLVASDYDGT